MPTLKPFFTYYGGKYRIAPKYPAPLFDTIVEPFAGAAGYSIRHYQKRVILIEKDPVIAALWKYLVRVSAEEIRALPLTVQDARNLSICQEAKSLIGFWLNTGTAGPRNIPSTRMRSGTRPNSYWGEAIRERVASQVEAIRHWQVYEGSYQDWSSSTAQHTWFVDPPYQQAGKHYRCSTVNYPALAAWCRDRQGQVIVCENTGAEWLPFRHFLDAKAMAGTSREAIWTSP